MPRRECVPTRIMLAFSSCARFSRQSAGLPKHTAGRMGPSGTPSAFARVCSRRTRLSRARATKYKVTSQRVVVETGLLSKVIEQVDLFRAVDFVVELPLGQRLVGCGTLRIEAQDKTAKEVRLDRIRTDVRALYESVRKAAEAERIRRGVRPLDTI